jgi:hypothetical protein
VLDVEGDGLGEMALELGFALGDPAGDVEERGGVVAGEGEDGVDEGIGFDEGAVEIDTEGGGAGEAALAREGGLGNGFGRDRSVLRYDGKRRGNLVGSLTVTIPSVGYGQILHLTGSCCAACRASL